MAINCRDGNQSSFFTGPQCNNVDVKCDPQAIALVSAITVCGQRLTEKYNKILPASPPPESLPPEEPTPVATNPLAFKGINFWISTDKNKFYGNAGLLNATISDYFVNKFEEDTISGGKFWTKHPGNVLGVWNATLLPANVADKINGYPTFSSSILGLADEGFLRQGSSLLTYRNGFTCFVLFNNINGTADEGTLLGARNVTTDQMNWRFYILGKNIASVTNNDIDLGVEFSLDGTTTNVLRNTLRVKYPQTSATRCLAIVRHDGISTAEYWLYSNLDGFWDYLTFYAPIHIEPVVNMSFGSDYDGTIGASFVTPEFGMYKRSLKNYEINSIILHLNDKYALAIPPLVFDPVEIFTEFFTLVSQSVMVVNINNVIDISASVTISSATSIDAEIASPSVVLQSITTSATTTPTPQAGNNLTLDDDFDAIGIWVGSLPVSTFRLDLHINDGSQTRTIQGLHNQFYILNANQGETLSFGSSIRNEVGFSTVPQSSVVKTAKLKRSVSLADPSGFTGTVNCDKNGPPFWNPTSPHILLPAYGSAIKVTAVAFDRDLFFVEFDDNNDAFPIRHHRINANETAKIRFLNKKVAVANYDGSTIEITGDSGTAVQGSSTMYSPSFTVVTTVAVTTAAELIAALASPTDGTQITLANGTYDISASLFSQANYTTAYTRNIKIKGLSGDYADVTITGGKSDFVIAQNKQWLFENITFDVTTATASGDVGLFQTLGQVHLHNCKIQGPGASVSPPYVIKGTSAFPTTPTCTYCVFDRSSEDLIDLQGNNVISYLMGCTLSGNGPGQFHQLLTPHNTSQVFAYGCRFTDASDTGNHIQIWGDENDSRVHLYYCRCLASDVSNVQGITLRRIKAAHFNVFEKVRLLYPETFTANASSIQNWVGNKFYKVTTSTDSTQLWLRWTQDSNTYSFLYGNHFKTNTGTNNNSLMDVRRAVESQGNIYECLGASNSIPLMVGLGGPTIAGLNARFYNDHFISANSFMDISTNANVGVDLINCLFTGSATSHTISATGATGVARNNYMEVAAADADFTTRFPTNSNNTFSTTNVTFDSNNYPTNAGSGFDQGYYGGIDSYGRVLILGGSSQRGSVEKQEIRSGAVLHPAIWV